jgi:hypothetical protein
VALQFHNASLFSAEVNNFKEDCVAGKLGDRLTDSAVLQSAYAVKQPRTVIARRLLSLYTGATDCLEVPQTFIISGDGFSSRNFFGVLQNHEQARLNFKWILSWVCLGAAHAYTDSPVAGNWGEICGQCYIMLDQIVARAA